MIPLYKILRLKRSNFYLVSKTPDICGAQTDNTSAKTSKKSFPIKILVQKTALMDRHTKPDKQTSLRWPQSAR